MANSGLEVSAESRSLSGIQYVAWAFAWLALVLDVMDWQFLAMAAPHVTKEYGFSMTNMGILLGAPLIGAGVGGIFSGWLADKMGRVKTMFICMCWYSLFTIFFPFSSSFSEMLVLRVLAGLGLGAQWGVGNTLVAELLPSRVRILASSTIQTGFAFGPLLAAYFSKLIIPAYGWKPLFYIGAVGFVLAFFALIFIPESPAWLEAKKRANSSSGSKTQLGNIGALLKGQYRSRAILSLLLVSGTLFAYWASMSWIPSWLAKDKGMSIISSMNYIIIMNVGGVIGFILFGLIADRFGRKPPAYVALIASTLGVLIFVNIRSADLLLWYAPFYAFFTYPIFGLYGGYLSELFPTEVRGTAVTGIYNFGRLLSFFGPYILGWVAGISSISVAIGATAVLYLVAIIPLAILPETIQRKADKPGKVAVSAVGADR
jgi:MFS family permease